MALLALVVLVLTGCGFSRPDDRSSPAKPSERDLARIRAVAQPPVFWLGEVYRGEAVSTAHVTRRGTSFTYGEQSCDPGSGCLYNISIHTSHERKPITETPACWRRL